MINTINNFSSIYVTFRIMLYLILMPLSGKNNYIDNMSKEAQDHYNSVKKDRKIKGCASIIISILLGLFINMKLVKKLKINKEY